MTNSNLDRLLHGFKDITAWNAVCYLNLALLSLNQKSRALRMVVAFATAHGFVLRYRKEQPSDAG